VVYVFLTAAVVLCAVSMKLLALGPKVRLAVAAVHEAAAVMASKELSERQKEAAVQSAAVAMFGHACSILGRVALALAGPLAFVLLGSGLGLYALGDAVRAGSDWSFILGSTVVMVGALLVIR
jgi:hypothetical protein